jgi:CHAT domain-containing protein
LGDLIKARLSNAEFAFLSACHSAAINIDNTPDEAIHLAAALQFCGFRSVVGTLWAMADVDGPDVAEDFYGYMFREPGSGGF